MIIEIFDVEHGSCAVITSPEGKRLMIDCGHNSTKLWWPSIRYYSQQIEELVIGNYDEDHVSDLQDLMKNSAISYITHNASVSSADLSYLKAENGMGPGIARLRAWMKSVEGQVSAGAPNLGSMRHKYFYNNYPIDFDDENNLSVISFVEWSGFKIIFPGDLEEAGWKKLLRRSDFKSMLNHINVFVASHHGRKTGCCDEVFDICNPRIVVMSDRDKVFDSQETVSWYANRCQGIRYNGKQRNVFTTRSDGNIRITVGPTSWKINCGW